MSFRCLSKTGRILKTFRRLNGGAGFLGCLVANAWHGFEQIREGRGWDLRYDVYFSPLYGVKSLTKLPLLWINHNLLLRSHKLAPF